MKFIVALIIFSVIIIIHEFGHFLFAKINGVGVIEFSLGMGPRIISKQIGETRYSLKLLPIGGSCAMVGEDMISDEENAFGNKGVWARISIVFGGPLFNFILAFCLSLLVIGKAGYDPAVLYDLGEEPTAMVEAGLKDGDKIVRLDGSRIYNYREMITLISMNQTGKSMEFTYERDGNIQDTTVTPKHTEEGNLFYGIKSGGQRVKGTFLQTLKYSALELRYWLKITLLSLKELILGHVGADEVSGPVGIVSFIGDTYQESSKMGLWTVILSMCNIGILLSANLGVMNLLPIPALDGGRLLFLLGEAITGKRLNQQTEGLIHLIGFALLMMVMVLVFYNDIRHLIV